MLKTSLLALAGVAWLVTGGPAAAKVQAAQPASSCAVHGTVRDQTGLPIPGAVVTVDQHRTVTGPDGRYCFTQAPDRGRIQVIHPGFATTTRDFDASRDPQAAIDLALMPPGFKDDVVVTATRTNRRLGDVPVRTEVVDTRSMQAIGARTLADAVEYTNRIVRTATSRRFGCSASKALTHRSSSTASP